MKAFPGGGGMITPLGKGSVVGTQPTMLHLM